MSSNWNRVTYMVNQLGKKFALETSRERNKRIAAVEIAKMRKILGLDPS